MEIRKIDFKPLHLPRGEDEHPKVHTITRHGIFWQHYRTGQKSLSMIPWPWVCTLQRWMPLYMRDGDKKHNLRPETETGAIPEPVLVLLICFGGPGVASGTKTCKIQSVLIDVNHEIHHTKAFRDSFVYDLQFAQASVVSAVRKVTSRFSKPLLEYLITGLTSTSLSNRLCYYLSS